MRHLYSTIGLILGFAAVSLAAFETLHVSGDPLSKKERSGWQIRLDKQSFSLKSKKDENASNPVSAVRITYTVFGLLAIGLGTFAWTRKENMRIVGGAAALGLIAIAWQWVLIGVCIAVVLFLFACFSA